MGAIARWVDITRRRFDYSCLSSYYASRVILLVVSIIYEPMYFIDSRYEIDML